MRLTQDDRKRSDRAEPSQPSALSSPRWWSAGGGRLRRDNCRRWPLTSMIGFFTREYLDSRQSFPNGRQRTTKNSRPLLWPSSSLWPRRRCRMSTLRIEMIEKSGGLDAQSGAVHRPPRVALEKLTAAHYYYHYYYHRSLLLSIVFVVKRERERERRWRQFTVSLDTQIPRRTHSNSHIRPARTATCRIGQLGAISSSSSSSSGGRSSIWHSFKRRDYHSAPLWPALLLGRRCLLCHRPSTIHNSLSVSVSAGSYFTHLESAGAARPVVVVGRHYHRARVLSPANHNRNPLGHEQSERRRRRRAWRCCWRRQQVALTAAADDFHCL